MEQIIMDAIGKYQQIPPAFPGSPMLSPVPGPAPAWAALPAVSPASSDHSLSAGSIESKLECSIFS